jgi:hypothetical protein
MTVRSCIFMSLGRSLRHAFRIPGNGAHQKISKKKVQVPSIASGSDEAAEHMGRAQK